MLVCLSDETGSLGRCVLTADCGANKLIAYELVEELLFILWENSDGVAELVHLAFDVRWVELLELNIVTICNVQCFVYIL